MLSSYFPFLNSGWSDLCVLQSSFKKDAGYPLDFISQAALLQGIGNQSQLRNHRRERPIRRRGRRRGKPDNNRYSVSADEIDFIGNRLVNPGDYVIALLF